MVSSFFFFSLIRLVCLSPSCLVIWVLSLPSLSFCHIGCRCQESANCCFGFQELSSFPPSLPPPLPFQPKISLHRMLERKSFIFKCYILVKCVDPQLKRFFIQSIQKSWMTGKILTIQLFPDFAIDCCLILCKGGLCGKKGKETHGSMGFHNCSVPRGDSQHNCLS